MELVKYSWNVDQSTILEIKKVDDLAFIGGEDIVWITQQEILDILEQGYIIAIYEKGDIVWHVQVQFRDNGEKYIFWIWILPEFQGKGIAKKLLEKVFDWDKDSIFTATVRPDNFPSIKLFVNHFRFKIDKFLPNHYGEWNHRFWMIQSDKNSLIGTTKVTVEDPAWVLQLLGDGRSIMALRDGYFIFED